MSHENSIKSKKISKIKQLKTIYSDFNKSSIIEFDEIGLFNH